MDLIYLCMDIFKSFMHTHMLTSYAGYKFHVVGYWYHNAELWPYKAIILLNMIHTTECQPHTFGYELHTAR